MEKRARARWRDIRKRATTLLSLPEFVAWYVDQPDCCAYCGLTFAEAKRLRLKTAGGYFVSWDIDRIDPARGYELGNLALSCFACNTAKGAHLTAAETRIQTALRVERRVCHRAQRISRVALAEMSTSHSRLERSNGR
jgi:5-methylcytosine-specific restriction endonuclease McrA